MKFRYKKLGPHFLRPIIPVEFSRLGQSVRYEVLVDSGADCNVPPAEIGELLGLRIEDGSPNHLNGITGEDMPFYTHPVTMRIGTWSEAVLVGFMPNMPPFGYGVVGQRGFFDRFKITFDHRRGEVVLKPNEGPNPPWQL